MKGIMATSTLVKTYWMLSILRMSLKFANGVVCTENMCNVSGVCYAEGEGEPDIDCMVCKLHLSTTELSLQDYKCFINGTCYDYGMEDPNVPSHICLSENSTTEFSVIDDYAIRLVNGEKTASGYTGGMEVFYNGEWGAVCDDGFPGNFPLTSTLCGFLGYSRGYAVFPLVYGETTKAFWLDDVHCSGDEADISECSHRPWGQHNCGTNEIASLVCSNLPIETYAMRLVNGEETPTSLSGRLEVLFAGVWGTVCDDLFNQETAAILCGFLGYSQGDFVPQVEFGAGTGPIWLDELMCSGEATNIDQCSHNPWSVNDCSHSEDVGLICSLRTDKCVIDNVLYDDGEADPNATCRVCSLVNSTTEFTLLSQGSCFIDGVCYTDGEVNPVNGCEHCDVSVSTSLWSHRGYYDLANGRTMACSAFCDLIHLHGSSMIAAVCSYPHFLTARNIRDMCYLKETSTAHCPAEEMMLTRYKAMCSHNTATAASQDPVVCS